MVDPGRSERDRIWFQSGPLIRHRLSQDLVEVVRSRVVLGLWIRVWTRVRDRMVLVVRHR